MPPQTTKPKIKEVQAPQLPNQESLIALLQELNERVKILESMNMKTFTDRIVFQKKLQMFDAQDMIFGSNKGTRIGTAITQKIGFFNATPVVQQAAPVAPSGGATIDTQARTAINTLITDLHNLGLTA